MSCTKMSDSPSQDSSSTLTVDHEIWEEKLREGQGSNVPGLVCLTKKHRALICRSAIDLLNS